MGAEDSPVSGNFYFMGSITPNQREILYVTDGLGNLVKLQGIAADGSLKVSANLKQSNTILFQPVSSSASGDNSVVALVASKKIKVLSVLLVSAGAVSVKWRSNTTDLSGAMPLVANSGFSLAASSPGQGHYFETAVGEALNINLNSAVAVSGHISYYTEA